MMGYGEYVMDYLADTMRYDDEEEVEFSYEYDYEV